MMNRPRTVQPSLFDVPEPTQPTPEKPEQGPEWDFETSPHLDLIGSEPIHAYVYDIETLERTSPYYGFRPTQGLLRALEALGKNKSKALRERAFTVFMGDAGPGYKMFVVGVGSTNADLGKAIRPFMRQVEGFETEEVGRSDSFIPTYRYDQGYVISYGEPDSAGEVKPDKPENFGTGLEFRTRWYAPPEMNGLRGSRYGTLKIQFEGSV